MKSLGVTSILALLVLVLGHVFVVSPATADVVSDFQVIGRGLANFTCQLAPLTPDCISNSAGDVRGTFIVSGTYTLSITAGPVGSPQSTAGLCFPANGVGQIFAAATGEVINYKTVGWICEDFIPGTPYHYNGTYRIDSPLNSGTGQFAAAAGGGSLTATFEKGVDGQTFIKFDGTIHF